MNRTSILIGIGANLSPDGYATPREGCEAAIASLADLGIDVVAVSPWYETTSMSAADALAALHRVEARFGRIRTVRNAARVLDLDLLDYGGLTYDDDNISIPHPRLHERAFVLLPMRDVAPGYSHPVSGLGIDDLIAALPGDQQIRKAD